MSEYSINDIRNQKIFNDSENIDNGGFFPLGKNTLWHGGIHLPYNNDAVRPLIAGDIVSYRLDKSELQCDFPHKITTAFYESKEASFYITVDKEKFLFKDCYEKKWNGYTLKEKYKNKKFTFGSGNYLLLKKSIEVEKNSTLVFYTLYMHLLPVERYLLENGNCIYVSTNNTQKKNNKNQIENSLIQNTESIPFYIRWKCEVSAKFENMVYVLNTGSKQIPPYYSVELNQPDFFKKDFSLNENTLLNLKHGKFEFKTKYKNITLNGDIKLKTKKDKIYLLKSISDLNSYKPPVFTINKDLIYTYKENEQEESKFRKVELNEKHDGYKEKQDSRKIYNSGFVPKENISENEKNKKKFVNKSCYLRYPDLSITPPDDVFIINQDGEKNEIWVNKKYALYPQVENEVEIFLPTETVVFNIIKRDENDNSFLKVKITEMCIFVSEDDLEQDTNDSNKYKVKEKLNHPIYIVDDKEQKFKNQLRFSFEQDETVTNEKRKDMKRLIFGEKGEFLLNKVFSASSENVKDYTEVNIDKIKYRRIIYHSESSFWIREDAFENRLTLSKEKLNDILSYENKTIKTKLDWGKIQYKKDYDNYLSLKIYEHPFESVEYFFYTQNKNLPIIKKDFSALRNFKYSKAADLEKLGVKLYCMKTSNFIYKDTPIEIFDISNTSYEKELKLKYIDTWEELSKTEQSALVQIRSVDEGLFLINEDDLQISKSKSGYVNEVQKETDSFILIKKNFVKCSSNNKESAEELVGFDYIMNLELKAPPKKNNNIIEFQTTKGTEYLYCTESNIDDFLLMTNFFDETIIKDYTATPSDCIGLAGNFLTGQKFIHLGLFTNVKIKDLKFIYFLINSNLSFKKATLHPRGNESKKTLILPTFETTFEILNPSPKKISIDYQGPLCVRLVSMCIYIHREDFYDKSKYKVSRFKEMIEENYVAKKEFKHPIYIYDKANKIYLDNSGTTSKDFKVLKDDFFKNGTFILDKQLEPSNSEKMKGPYQDPTNQDYYRFRVNNPAGPIYYIYPNEIANEINAQKKYKKGDLSMGYIDDDCKNFIIDNRTGNVIKITVSDNIDYTTLEDISISDDEVDFPVFKRNLGIETVYTIPANFNEYKRWGAEIQITEEKLYKFPLEKKVDDTVQTVEVYVKKDELDKKARRDKLELEDFFNVQVADNKEDLKCDIQKDIIKKLNEKKTQNAEEIKDIEQIYKEPEKYKSVREELHRMVCKFPFEWDKEFYDTSKYSYISDLSKNIMDAADIREKLNSIEGLKNEKCFYHFNPAYFLGKLDEWGLLEFNPYMVVTETLKTSANNIKIISNPGFVPYEEKYTRTDGYSTYISQKFNEKVSGNYYHEGVDIPVEWKEGIPIKALINGQVVYSNDQTDWSYGRFIVIKASNKYHGYNIYYLLAHLDRNKNIAKTTSFVFPGLTVGYVGNTGHCKSGDIDMNGPGYDKQRATGMGRHLHLEVFKTKSENFEESFVTDISKIKKDKKVEVKYENAPIVNPFNFDEPYIKGKQE
ncbi:MAG: M23 family metallopeptidase [Treponema sp.]|uniref:M23 family metallopeptidase n=1 Tax=Treponema sp. TaxID=166 RepID=UPI0025FA91A1|nr:M23 family metallopeptidase [Treponema sp.]MBQ8680634.1 M23 family metallopeptidase [Treponema sp.]